MNSPLLTLIRKLVTEMMEFIRNHADRSLDYDEELVRFKVEIEVEV